MSVTLLDLVNEADVDVNDDESLASVTVKLAMQPNYPFEYSVGEVALVWNDDGESELWLAEGGQTGYLGSEIRSYLGW